MDPLIVTVAPVGAELSPEQTPHLAVTPVQLGAVAAGVRAAGAALIHVHCRNDDGSNTHDVARFRAAYEAIRASSDLIVQFSTGGAVGMTPHERAAPLVLRPEMATLSCGSMNFGDDIFENSFPIMRGILAEMRRFGVMPELEIFDRGHLSNAVLLARQGYLTLPQHVDFVLGVPGGLDASIENLVECVRALPAGCTWSVAGIGRMQLPLTVTAIAMGGEAHGGTGGAPRTPEAGRLVDGGFGGSPLFTYIVRRTLQNVPLLLLISIILYAILSQAPGGPLTPYLQNPHITEADIARLKHNLGLDQPVYIQYLHWLSHVVRGDFGYSTSNSMPVMDAIADRMPATLSLMGSAMIVSLVIGVAMGIYSALRPYSFADYAVTTFAFFGQSMPVFWFALMLQLVFAVHGFEAFGYRFALPSAGIADSDTFDLGDRLRHLVLPTVVLSLLYVAQWSRFMRSSMLEVVKTDYIRTASAKGLSQ
ncbi:MAG: 3-keto-5-aminohexanoate cleavage protein, partial [Candidatus Velthaea sp.]